MNTKQEWWKDAELKSVIHPNMHSVFELEEALELFISKVAQKEYQRGVKAAFDATNEYNSGITLWDMWHHWKAKFPEVFEPNTNK